MKEPKKIKKAVKSLNKLVNYLEYFMGDSKQFKTLIHEDVEHLEKILLDLGCDQKKHDTRLAKKLKKTWEIQQKRKESDD